MHIHDHSNYGIRGTAVTGLTLADSVINGTNGTNGCPPFEDSSAAFDDLFGHRVRDGHRHQRRLHANLTVDNTARAR